MVVVVFLENIGSVFFQVIFYFGLDHRAAVSTKFYNPRFPKTVSIVLTA